MSKENETIKEILMRRDGMTAKEAEAMIRSAVEELEQGLMEDNPNYDICEDFFGLEPDYLDDLMQYL